MSHEKPSVVISDSVSDIASNYDAWMCDIWGVIHNGVRPFEHAYEACQRFKEEGGTVVLLTNSPRPSEAVRLQLGDVGVPENAYDGVVSSGDVARSLVASRSGRPIYHLGPDRDHGIFEGLDVDLREPQHAEAVLCSGLFDDESETPDDYEPLLTELLARQLPLICANPDIVVERGDKLVYCAGALAERYGSMGGEVIYTGKPHQPIYDLALDRLRDLRGSTVETSRVLAIGDGLKTDIAGAFGARLDVVFVASAIHVEGHKETTALSSAVVGELFDDFGQRPVLAMPRLQW